MLGDFMNIMDFILGIEEPEIVSLANEGRPVRLVPEGNNVWRVVYADETA